MLGVVLAAPCAAQDRQWHTVTVQPVVVRGDDRSDAAAHRIPEAEIDQTFAGAHVDVHFVEPLFMDDTAARDGAIGPDELVRRAREQQLVHGPGRLLTLFFVRAIGGDGTGRKAAGGTPGTALVVLDGQADSQRDANGVSQAIAAGLRLAERASKEGRGPDRMPRQPTAADETDEDIVMTPDQIEWLRQHPLVRPYVYCLPRDEARRVMLDETYEPYFSRMQRREIGAVTREAPTADTLEGCRDEARLRFSDGTLAFTDREADALAESVAFVQESLGDRYPLLQKQPWRFVKFDNSICSGFPHTRGDCILLSQAAVDRVVVSQLDQDDRARRQVAALLVHEQMHVLQRLYPTRFADFATRIVGLVRADVVDHPWLIERQIQNPDALRLEWLIRWTSDDGQSQWWWPRSVLTGDAPVPRLGVDWRAMAVQVEPRDGQYHVITDSEGVPVNRPLSDFAPVLEPFAMTGPGRDHPNELAAYASTQLLYDEPAGQGNSEFLTWCREHLR